MDPTQNGGKRKKVEKVCKILALTWRAMVMMRNMLTMMYVVDDKNDNDNDFDMNTKVNDNDNDDNHEHLGAT